jgi:hypothetical protein
MSHDPLRFAYLTECAELMRSYCVCLGEGASRGNEAVVRAYFEALRAVGKDIDTTLKEIEASAKREAA